MKDFNIKFKYSLTFYILLWEKLCLAAMPLLAAVIISISIILLEVPVVIGNILGSWSQLCLILLILLVLLWYLKLGWNSFQIPNSTQIKRRLELWNGSDHRPLDVLDDTPSNARNYISDRIWKIHNRIVSQKIRKFKIGAPAPIVSEFDRFGIRAGIGVLLITSLCISWKDMEERLYLGIFPAFSSQIKSKQVDLDLWIDPPEYTNRPSFMIERSSVKMKKGGIPSADEVQPVNIPVGSTISGALYGGTGAIRLVLKNAAGQVADSKSLEYVASGQYSIVYEPFRDGEITINQGSGEVAKFIVSLIPDQAPLISWSQPPTIHNKKIHLQFSSSDDYGVASISALIVPTENITIGTTQNALNIELISPYLASASHVSVKELDLLSHIWAGQSVAIRLIASDRLGQTSLSKPRNIILPERIFNHPVAKKLNKIRSKLFRNFDQKSESIKSINTFLKAPELFGLDYASFLNLKSTSFRLSERKSKEVGDEVLEMLWKTANYLEDGQSAILKENIRMLEALLREPRGKQRNPDEINRQLDVLSRELEKYLNTRVGIERKNVQELSSKERFNNYIGGTDLRKILQDIRNLIKSGSKELAREMLSNLGEIIQKLQTNGAREANSVAQTIQGLYRLAAEQQVLMDKTYSHSILESITTTNEPITLDDARTSIKISGQQRELATQVADLIKELESKDAEIVSGLRRSLKHIEKAANRLDGRSFERALDEQDKAITTLIAVAEGMAKNLDFISRENPLKSLSKEPQLSRRTYRLKSQKFLELKTIKMPTEIEIRKTREILEEIRRRRSQFKRPDIELKYLERLLGKF